MSDAKTPRRREGGKPWGGRFAKKTHPLVDAYTSSLDVDATLYSYDIRASIAHARMLGRQRIIPRADADAIVRGLREIEREIERGEFEFDSSLEDIHTNIEARLAEKIGDEPAGRLHTARSRNDQVATDLRLYAMEAITHLTGAIRGLQSALLDVAEQNASAVMPGYTHLQRAQPVLLAHHFLAYVEMLERDFGRFAGCYVRSDVLPLGSGALAGVPYPVDRASVAKEWDSLRRAATASMPSRIGTSLPNSLPAPPSAPSTFRGWQRRSSCGRARSSALSRSMTPSRLAPA